MNNIREVCSYSIENSGELGCEIKFSLFLEEQQIGTSEVYFIDGGDYLAGYMDQADLHSYWNPYDAMYSIEFDGVNGITKNIGYIHNLIIFEDFRERGYASIFLKEIEKTAKDKGIETMILQPYPLEPEIDFHFSQKECLVDFYERKGYQLYKTKQPKDEPYYFKNL